MNTFLETKNLEKSYHDKKVVDDVSIKVNRGEIVGLLGPNGAGKTTTFSLILGLIPQDKGQVFLDKEDITNLPMYTRSRQGICLLPQEPSVFRKLSVEDNLCAIKEALRDSASIFDQDLIDMLEEFGLEKVAKAKAYTLSGGERRRLEIARALITHPSFMLLDEPFTGIDPLAVSDLQNLILSLKNKKIGLLITDHSVRETLRITDRAYIIDKGKILMEGSPESLVSSSAVKERYLGDDFHLD
jgi:lipopolysaccharide export system ATP-binding protein